MYRTVELTRLEMDRDPLLRRVERNALRACAVMALLALAWRGGRPDLAAAVAGGGLLAAISYRGIKGGIDALVTRVGERGESGARTARGWALVKFFTRYAMLALAAYIVIVRLRLHPVGVLLGASSLVVAAALEAARQVRAPSRSHHPD